MTDTSLPANVQLGFLTVVAEGAGQLGGLLVANSWGRPIEFRLSTAVQPNRLQQILYGPTLREYLSADLIGKTLVDKCATGIHLLVIDSPDLLEIRSRLECPVLAIPFADEPFAEAEQVRIDHPRCSKPLVYSQRYAGDAERIGAMLDQLDAGLDLCEPFNRIREAMTESRRMGVQQRAAA